MSNTFQLFESDSRRPSRSAVVVVAVVMSAGVGFAGGFTTSRNVSPANGCAVRPACSNGFHAVFQDQHDGDQKEASIEKNELIIKPHANSETWEVRTAFDHSTCVAASVDFNVTGKPSPPPFNGTLTLFSLADEACATKAAFVFTCGVHDKCVFTTNKSSTFPLNTWVEIK